MNKTCVFLGKTDKFYNRKEISLTKYYKKKVNSFLKISNVHL